MTEGTPFSLNTDSSILAVGIPGQPLALQIIIIIIIIIIIFIQRAFIELS
jgi:hypothetical protein